MSTESLIVSLIHRAGEHVVQSLLLIFLVSLTLYTITNEFVRRSARVSGMPGPRGLPLIGNLWDIRINAAVKYFEWSKTYGPVYQVQMGNVPVVVVNSAAAAKTLFTGTQALSSRPQTYTFHKIASSTAGLTIGTSPYDDSLKRRKKGAAVALNRPAIQSYVPYLDVETRDFVRDLLRYGKGGSVPVDPLPMVQRLSLSLAMTINWGVRVPSHLDPFFRVIVDTEEELNRFRSTTGNLQDYVPLLRLLSPFSGTSARARQMRDRRDEYLGRLNRDLAESVRQGTNRPCIQASAIQFKEERISDEELMSISLSVLGGGFETVASTVQWSMGFLARHPDIQEKAYREIRAFYAEQQKGKEKGDENDDGDDVFNPLCDAGDDMKCAYIAGLAKEALRYFTVIPLALPRESIKDVVWKDESNGSEVVIPKGTTFYMNAWACNYGWSGTHTPLAAVAGAQHQLNGAGPNASLWPDPTSFRPERWLDRPDAPLFTFGLGYRMCAAHMLATRELYLIFMRLLACFRLEPPASSSPSHIAGEKKQGTDGQTVVSPCEKEEDAMMMMMMPQCESPVADLKNPRDLIMAPRAYRVRCVPRDGEETLWELLETAAEERDEKEV